MNKIAITVASAGALTAIAVGLAGAATAAPSGSGSAADVMGSLQSQGYSVQLNGTVSAPLSACVVNDVHGLPRGTGGASGFTTVYIDVSCPPTNN
ncbi:hypothetical protein [Mycobacterium sp.]|jgi:hypothetical protein|uniref:hypothetical protein n=1 Tax=Mycobacterium sp. TaxID=1785 RepID=UPI002D532D6B|nr:hypothetical protein [Mycobacterium sp.]HZA08935.1 hypothetical protein [Mycobacterium sp.]